MVRGDSPGAPYAALPSTDRAALGILYEMARTVKDPQAISEETTKNYRNFQEQEHGKHAHT